MMSDEEGRPHWVFDKRVNVAHVLTTLGMAAALGVYMVKQEARLVILEEHRQAQLTRDVRQDQDVRDMKTDIAQLFREIRDELRALRQDVNGVKK